DYGIDNFTITTENRTSEYYPVIYLEPQNDRNKRAIGYDTYSEKLRKIAIDSAIESGRGTLSGKIILVQEIDEDVQNGFLLMMPVFSSGKNSPEENNPMSVIGMVNGVFRINDFVEGLFGKHQFEYIHMRIYDQIEIPENLFFDSKEFYEYETREVDFSSKHNLEFGSRSWIIIYEGTAPPLNSVERVVSIFLPIAGFGMSGLLFYVFYLGDKNLQLIKNSLKNEKITTVGKLSANLAHDLRNPLSIITGCLYLLSRYSENSDEKNKNLISKSNVAVKKMNEQINDVLNFVSSRKLQLSEVSLKELINKPGILPEIPDNINLNLPQNDILLNCDKLKIEVLINNMIINSIQAIGEKTGTITIRLSEDQKNAVIEVIDSGPGISKNNMKEIFEPLFSTKSKGIGLGLASCEHIVKSHRGKIIVKNKPTKFTILIPK
ncbi:MAG: CHASE domain-containing protein, partial [Nitrosopumilus sp.]|nr:CHASE domain-containing protein [Nitrosopumilus sp.]